MALFAKHEPTFIKGNLSVTVEIDTMRALLPHAATADRLKLKRDITLVEAGIVGEERAAFKLRNGHIPTCVLSDLYFEHQGLSAQIDFMVIMPYVNVVVKCKNFVGDIEVNNRGDFIRTFGSGKYHHTERICSPITQYERHLQLIRTIWRDSHSAFVGALADRYFNKIWKLVVVLANQKSVLNDHFAKKEIRCQTAHANGLIARPKELEAAGNAKFSLKECEKTAQRWPANSVERKIDLSENIGLLLLETLLVSKSRQRHHHRCH